MPSKHILASLLDIENLRKLCQSLAMLDAVMCESWDSRYCSFDSKWNVGEMLGTMRNGAGDEYYIYFSEYGAIIKGFDHESEMNLCDEPEEVWKGVLDAVPSEFDNFLQDDAFPREYTTFCLWNLNNNPKWQTGQIEYPNDDEKADGSNWMLFLLDGSPETYRDWAKTYYNKEICLETVKKIYSCEPLSEEMVVKLNPKRNFADLTGDIEEIGYPKLNI